MPKRLLLAVLAMAPVPALGATLQVGPTRPYVDLGAALVDAQDNDRIEIDPGFYVEPDELDIVQDGLEIVGPGAVFSATYGGTLWAVFGVDVSIDGVTFDGEGSRRALFVEVGAELTLTNAEVLNTYSYDSGGAILVEGDLVVEDTSFNGSVSDANGGAVRAWTDSVLAMDRCSVTSSQADRGGAVSCRQAAACEVSNSTFQDNVAYEVGGALHVSDTTAKLFGNVFCRNQAGLDGGALSLNRSILGFERNAVVDNQGGYGGAIRLVNSDAQSLNNHFLGNDSTAYGSAVDLTNGSWVSVNDLVAFNSGFGFALDRVPNQTLELSYSAFFGNTSSDGDHNGTEIEGNLFGQDPLLTDYVPGDCNVAGWVPLPDSPLIDAGDPTETDPDGTRSDIGAFGAQTPGTGTTPTTPGTGCEGTWYPDLDGDGFGADRSAYTGCNPPGNYVDNNGDCDDTDPDVNPGATDRLGDDVDNDCDGTAAVATWSGGCGCATGGPPSGVWLPLLLLISTGCRRSRPRAPESRSRPASDAGPAR